MDKINISKPEAVDIILNAQLLDGKTKPARGKKGLMQVISRLGYIQIDTISVINRAHHHILWTRKNDYTEKHLHDLQAKDKLIFEYWTHAMSFIPMADYRYVLPCMKNFDKPKSKWLKYRLKQSKKYLQPVLDRIRNEGPLSSSSFEDDPKHKGGTWWEWKPTKTALEYLFWRGDLMVAERKGFQKYYDLRERVLPPDIDTTMPTKNELSRYFIHRALSALGIASEKEILKFMQPGRAEESDLQTVDKKSMLTAMDELCETGAIIEVSIDDDKKTVNYTLPEAIGQNGKRRKNNTQIHLLSPFDNLIIQRERTKRLFGFDYTIECYVPAPKRKYGYFVLPVLWGNRFIGRLDPKADRQNNTFIVNNLVFENNFDRFDELLPILAQKLSDIASFNNCTDIKFINSPNKKYISALQKEIKTQK